MKWLAIAAWAGLAGVIVLGFANGLNGGGFVLGALLGSAIDPIFIIPVLAAGWMIRKALNLSGALIGIATLASIIVAAGHNGRLLPIDVIAHFSVALALGFTLAVLREWQRRPTTAA
jgi:hypothetical protein